MQHLELVGECKKIHQIDITSFPLNTLYVISVLLTRRFFLSAVSMVGFVGIRDFALLFKVTVQSGILASKPE